jgi:hypothetical protein
MCSRERILVVQLGNVVERGPASKAVLEVIDMLDQVLGWQVVSLLGNRELTSHFASHTSIVNPRDALSFGGHKARRAAFAQGGSAWKLIADKYGLVARVGDTLFAHAGVDPAWLAQLPGFSDDGVVDIDALNEWARATLLLDSEMSHWLMSSQSPLFTRILSESGTFTLCNRILPRLQKLFEVKRIVVGHFPAAAPRTRCKDQIVFADFGMSLWTHVHKGGMSGFVWLKLRDGRVSNVSWPSELTSSLKLERRIKIRIVPHSRSPFVQRDFSLPLEGVPEGDEDIVDTPTSGSNSEESMHAGDLPEDDSEESLEYDQLMQPAVNMCDESSASDGSIALSEQTLDSATEDAATTTLPQPLSTQEETVSTESTAASNELAVNTDAPHETASTDIPVQITATDHVISSVSTSCLSGLLCSIGPSRR